MGRLRTFKLRRSQRVRFWRNFRQRAHRPALGHFVLDPNVVTQYGHSHCFYSCIRDTPSSGHKFFVGRVRAGCWGHVYRCHELFLCVFFLRVISIWTFGAIRQTVFSYYTTSYLHLQIGVHNLCFYSCICARLRRSISTLSAVPTAPMAPVRAGCWGHVNQSLS